MSNETDITQLYSIFFKEYPEVISTKDIMKILDVSDKTLYKLLRSGKLKSIKIGKSYRIPKMFLLQYLGIIPNS